MTEPMVAHWTFPTLVTQMIMIGEGTGAALDAMLSKIAEFYEEVEIGRDRLKSLFEPIMNVFLAGVVGVIVM
ncbi:type II secretion system F family protein [Neobacillus cucumis]|jgi:type IV pilus assembly protein PilC|nr:type II secretion system F family protein [Neobacillus cucumis]